MQLQSDFCLSQVVDQLTRTTPNSSSIIDLVLLSNHHSFISSGVHSPLGTSAHNSVIVCPKTSSKRKPSKPPTKLVWLYKSTDLPEATCLLKELPVAPANCNIDLAWRQWHKSFLVIIKKVIPRKKVPAKSITPWITQDIRQDIKRRERYFTKAKRSCSQDWALRYKALRNVIVNKIRMAKKSFFEALANPQSSKKKFWAVVRSLNPWSVLSPSSLSNGCTSATSDQDKANLLNDFFASCFNQVKLPPFKLPDPKPSDLPLDYFDSTPEEVSLLLRNLKPHFASGPDEISVWMLHTFADDVAPSISALFNISIVHGQLPADWKLSNVVPIPKEPGKQEVHFFSSNLSLSCC